MAVRARAVYPPEPSSVATARHDLHDQLAGAGLADAAPLACLLASELVTNAVRHAGTALAMTVEWNGERLRVEVEDLDDAAPVPRLQPRDEPGGLGLVIVSEMATRWGYRPSRDDGGKVVWFELGAAALDPFCAAAC